MTKLVTKLVSGLTGSLIVTALDIGARGGVKSDLALIAPVVDYYLFEPDEEEAGALRGKFDQENWHSVTVIVEALGARDEHIILNLYRQRGCSSKFVADRELAKLYLRDDYYFLDGTIDVPVRPLDALVAEGALPPPDFMKIDVQGMEGEVFDGAACALAETLVGVRTEVSFSPLYKGQPLFSGIDSQLRQYGLVPMRWIETHEWRRCTRAKFPQIARGRYPASRGQMMHADVLYLLHPESLESETEGQVERLARLGLVAASYDHYDHAAAAFARPRVSEYIQDKTSVDPVQMLEALSREFARRARHQSRMERAGRLIARLSGIKT